MRLLHVTHQYHPAIGGAERYITELSEALARRGHGVDVYTSRAVDYHTWQSVLPETEQINGVNIRRFAGWRRRALTWRVLEFGFQAYWRTGWRLFEPLIFYGNGPVCPRLFAAVLRNAGHYDLVHISQLHYAHAYTVYAAARLRKLPVVLTPHLHAEQRATYDIGYMRTMLATSQALLADTRGEQEFLLAHFPDQPVVLGGHGLNLAQFPPRHQEQSRTRFDLPPDAFVLLALGRKTEYKGLESSLQAFLTLRQRRPDVYFLAIGPETAYSRQLWAKHGPIDGLIVRDAVADEERLDALAACDVLCLPSTGEAFGIVYLEAWAYAKPVIGANIRAVASLIDNSVDGYVVDPAQPGQLLRALYALANDPQGAAAMGQRGQAKLHSRYTIDRIADVVEATYRRVLRHQRSRLTVQPQT